MMRHRAFLSGVSGTIGLLAMLGLAEGPGLLSRVSAQQNPNGPPATGAAEATATSTGRTVGGIETFHVQADVYVLAGAGGNITVEAGSQGIVVVDTGTTAMADNVIAAIRRLSSKPIRYVLNTSADPDHVGGNEKIVLAGEAIPGRNFAGEGAELIAQEKVLNRLSDAHLPISAIPTSSYFVPHKDLYFNDQAIQLIHEPAAHTDGDSMVFFRKSDVLSVGDLYSTTSYPVIDAKHGGSITGVLAALNHILDLQVAGEKEEGGTMVIPGHGRVADEADVVEYRDMVTILRDRIQDLARRGQTLEQVKAADVALDFDGVYGTSASEWTTAMFVEAVYRDVSKAAPMPAKGPAKPAKGTPRRAED